MSDFMKDPMVLREIIMDHYEYPRNHKLTDNCAYCTAHMASDSCVDDIKVQTLIEDGIIKDVVFDGVACTISTASTSIMTELVKGKSIQQAKEIMENYFAMIQQKEYDQDLLLEANAFYTVGNQANRINCATIGWNGLKQCLKESEGQDEPTKE